MERSGERRIAARLIIGNAFASAVMPELRPWIFSAKPQRKLRTMKFKHCACERSTLA